MKSAMRPDWRTLSASNTSLGALLVVLALIVGAGLASAWTMEHHGHVITGMNQQVVWGLPHVFAVFLVVAASGALHVASMSSVFKRAELKPLAPLSGLLAICLLAGGLLVLVLDLGRADRLLVTLTNFNPMSIFAWNIVLYSGFMALVAGYLWSMIDRTMNEWTPRFGLAAFIWRVILTTGTGSIFGFLVGRQAFGTTLMGPLFVMYSLAYGMAAFVLVLVAVSALQGTALQDGLLKRIAKLLNWTIVGALYGTVVYHATQLYFARQWGVEAFILKDGGIYTQLFWIGQVAIGVLAPLWLLRQATVGKMIAASMAVILGGIAQMYVTIIGAQAFPIVVFPGQQVNSSFADGVVGAYHPSGLEMMLGVGGIAAAILMVFVALRVLSLLPARLAQLDGTEANA